MAAYKIDNCTLPIKVFRPGENFPSFYVGSMDEAFMVIDLDKALTDESVTSGIPQAKAGKEG